MKKLLVNVPVYTIVATFQKHELLIPPKERETYTSLESLAETVLNISIWITPSKLFSETIMRIKLNLMDDCQYTRKRPTFETED